MLRNGPTLWEKILRNFPSGAIIAGGAVRDFLLLVDPKDIDVFLSADVEWPKDDDGELFVAMDSRCGLYRIDNHYERQEEYQTLNDIQLVSTGEMLGYRVDCIEFSVAKTSEQIASEFDFGLNQVWYDGANINFLPAFRADYEAHVVTLCHQDRLERSKARFDRFNERHGGDWRLVL